MSQNTKHFFKIWWTPVSNSRRLKVAITPGNFEGKPHFLARQMESDTSDSGRNSPIESRFGISVQLDDADIALFPFDLSDVLRMQDPSHEALTTIIDSNRESGLRTVCVMWHDFSQPLAVGQPQAIVLRSSMVRGLDYTEEFPIPTNFRSNDLKVNENDSGILLAPTPDWIYGIGPEDCYTIRITSIK